LDSYKEAAKIDKNISTILLNNPITRENALNWLNFCRTIISGLDILHMEAKDLLKPLGSDGEEGGHR